MGQTVPQPTGDNPEWGSVGGSGGGGGGGGGGAGPGGSGVKAAGARASSVSMMDQSRGPGFLSGGSDALLQVTHTQKNKTKEFDGMAPWSALVRSLENRALMWQDEGTGGVDSGRVLHTGPVVRSLLASGNAIHATPSEQ